MSKLSVILCSVLISAILVVIGFTYGLIFFSMGLLGVITMVLFGLFIKLVW